MATKDLYAEEMSVWLEQQQIRLKDCKISITEYFREIANFKQLIKLERSQVRIIKKRIANAEKAVAKYLAKKRSKKK